VGKAVSFFLIVFIVGVIFSGAMSSGGGFVVTSLSAPLTSVATSITVSSTASFLDSDYLYIGGEKVLYATKDATHFLGVTRGVSGTAVAHSLGDRVYTEQATILNEVLQINPTAVRTNSGLSGIIQIPIRFFTHALPNLVAMDFDFFKGDMAYVGYIFMACSFGLVISLAMGMLWMAAGVIKLVT
jgi:hypothetical protein